MSSDLVDLPPPSRKSSNGAAAKKSSSLLPEAFSSFSSPSSLVAALLAAAASTDRGAGGTRRERAAVEALAAKLERASRRRRTRRAKEGKSDLLDLLKGRWSLVYSSAQPFRSSPFSWGFSKAVGSVAAAEAIFAFTDALPFARIGTARQEVRESTAFSSSSSVSSSSSDEDLLWITSDVGLTVAGASGRVVTESSASVVVESRGSGFGSGRGDGEDEDEDEDDLSPLLTLSVRPVSTCVEGSAMLPGPLGRTRVPVGEALDAVAGFTGRVLSGGSSGGAGKDKSNNNGSSSSSSSSSCATLLEITYLDDSLRIGRTPRDGHLFVYAREEE